MKTDAEEHTNMPIYSLVFVRIPQTRLKITYFKTPPELLILISTTVFHIVIQSLALTA